MELDALIFLLSFYRCFTIERVSAERGQVQSSNSNFMVMSELQDRADISYKIERSFYQIKNSLVLKKEPTIFLH